ncbi:MAG: TIGR00159 family protein [Desulfobulbaceae bacterium]|uniref:Diadenylate cyclase n=1 Tax=Candidatus Desulfobia pelagia TaxID=2841692 RepID=A0A8J6NF27_9BACT|nr:TIGR00159 family protein [Candidatus Desulfobia pelagia]
MLELLKSLRWQDILDILIVSFIIYRIILLIKGTRAFQMVVGIGVLIVVYFGARELEFMTLYWLLGTFLSSIFLIIIIVFQRDIRRALTQVGQTPFTKTSEDTSESLEEIVKATRYLSDRQIGSLIVIERETGLQDYIESSHMIDAHLSMELLVSLFYPESPLHDGGVIISKGRIVTARSVLPLTRNPYISKDLGTRHRAAIGISEETDAVVVVVSEETKRISLVLHGGITSDLDIASLRNRLEAIFVPKEFDTTKWKNWLQRK